MPMSAGDWLAATGAVLLALVLGGLLFALGSVVLTLRELRATVRALQEQSIAMADEMRIALRDAEHEVDRVGALLSAAEMVGDRVDTASKIVSKTVTNPVVKVLALGTGTKRAVRRMRRAESEAELLRTRSRSTSGAWAERPGPQDRERER
jgi:prophage DNA circulation protein